MDTVDTEVLFLKLFIENRRIQYTPSVIMMQRSRRCQRGLLGMARRKWQLQQKIITFQTPIRYISTRLPSSTHLLPFANPTTIHEPSTSTSTSTFIATSIFSNSTTRRWKSLAQQVAATNQKKAKPLANVRKQLWEFYFSTGRGASALFEVIDLKETGTLEPNEVKAFISEVLSYEENGTTVQVDPREIMPYAWNILEKREQENQKYDIRDFKKWLVAATKMSADTKNSRLMEYLSMNPSVGENSYLSDAEEEPPVFTWNEESMSQSLRRMQYAVRGEVVMKADQLAAQGKEILYTNIGNPHQVGQSPITYYRQVLALCDLPAECGVDHPKVYDMFPSDVVDRAREYRGIIGPSGTGAYTHSQGMSIKESRASLVRVVM